MSRAEHVHLSGIGGIAMASLAGMLAESGYRVTGSDTNVYPPASDLLRAAKIDWKAGFREENLDPRPDWVVIGNALSRGNPEVECILDRKIPYRSLPQVIEDRFLPGHHVIVISGTHGKTTTTSLLAWILHSAGRRPDFLVGGVVQDFGSSYGLGGGEEFVIEGDEYDSAFFDKAPKFLHYHPDDLIITSLEFDHADIYANLGAIELQFERLLGLMPRHGRVAMWGESETVRKAAAKAFCPVESYGLADGCDWRATDLEFTGERTCFRVSCKGREVGSFEMRLAGRHNVANALAAIAIATGRGVSATQIGDGLHEFRGVRRRLEPRGEARGVLVVDDFAHHPTAIRETISAARLRWPGRRIWAAFEPRSNTMRRKLLENELADALATADAAIIGPVNRPQLLGDDERLGPARVVARIERAGQQAWAFDSAARIAEFIAAEARPGDLALILSNGSFDGLCEKLLATLAAGPQ
ncbi:MAG TPA: UDP-N-acetylmuramate:L-alanyl-gamma-D-glutamyl-meso-diaminopimelate ligase [Candidatus Dormibacteraeota bacterium]|nr:UDP-N-acetylmuramate:L-alanyl-gamma-D-glutamyl-meso-diaminopimelate ligase [Candidatus Dormibacteraeota bacterium]